MTNLDAGGKVVQILAWGDEEPYSLKLTQHDTFYIQAGRLMMKFPEGWKLIGLTSEPDMLHLGKHYSKVKS